MYEVTVEQTFAAAHALRNYKGKCENVHGHNWKVEVTVVGERLDNIGLLVDFADVKRFMHEVFQTVDHQFLNEVPPFTERNPSAENIARYLHDEISARIASAHPEVPVHISQVKVWETETSAAVYRP
ncbi:MAG: 6-carboxytetrahydropterin synthase QueD [Acidobacteria bacterium]|nr:6-carboxytetrahydropterin synthase QueD [Acidobacteriota bacterium]